MTDRVPLRNIAKVVRSKNAGPFEITFDVIFKTREDYEAVKATGVLTRQLISKLYDMPTQRIVTFLYFDAANAIKATIPRPRPQGSVGEVDMHAAQQHVPLMDVLIPWSRSSE
jgi:hypothetical protein